MASANSGLPPSNAIFCGFCKRNKEPESVYTSHQLRDPNGQVTCPQLFKYRCELCGATGAEAHTRSYCPSASNLFGIKTTMAQPLQEFGTNRSATNAQRQPWQAGNLSNARMYRNMGQVTNSRYNSAGRLRRPPLANRTSHNSAGRQVDVRPYPIGADSCQVAANHQQETSFHYMRQ